MVELPYGEQFRQQRVAFQKNLDPTALVAYKDIEKYETIKLLDLLLRSPSDFYQIIRMYEQLCLFCAA